MSPNYIRRLRLDRLESQTLLWVQLSKVPRPIYREWVQPLRGNGMNIIASENIIYKVIYYIIYIHILYVECCVECVVCWCQQDGSQFPVSDGRSKLLQTNRDLTRVSQTKRILYDEGILHKQGFSQTQNTKFWRLFSFPLQRIFFCCIEYCNVYCFLNIWTFSLRTFTDCFCEYHKYNNASLLNILKEISK